MGRFDGTAKVHGRSYCIAWALQYMCIRHCTTGNSKFVVIIEVLTVP
jgi:hypothetical protein